MGNGAIGPFIGAVNDPTSNLATEAQNVKTVRDYYDRVYTAEDFGAIATFVTPQVKIHRDGQVLKGRAAVTAQVQQTVSTHRPVNVAIREVVAFKDRVTYGMTVEYTRPGSGGVRERRRGIAHTRLRGGQIAETWVSYEPPESV